MMRRIIVLLFVFALAVCSAVVVAQSKKEDLQKQRDELNDKIATTKKLIREAESKQKTTRSQLAALNEQISFRESLIRNLSRDIKGIENEIGRKELNIAQLQQQLEAMKSEYGEMIYQAYKNRSSYNKLMFIFSARDFNQAFKRFKLTQRYADVRKQQAASIREMQVELGAQLELLETDRADKQKLASSKEEEKREIDRDKQEQQSKLNSLKSEEKKLREQQKKQEADRKKLTSRIEAIIQEELAAERKRNAEAGTKTATSGAKSSSASTLAPEVISMNSDFEKNKGTLPWPVSSGVILSKFGRQAHPTIAGIEIDNKGVDFATEQNGAALAVFGGTVTSVFNIPGAGETVIVTHGTYKTVYSGLSTVNVKVGDKVTTKQKIGTVMHDGDDSILHFELWKVTQESGSAQNPESWIKKR